MIADLLRHGQTGFSGFRGCLDDPLTAEGWQAMQQATRGTEMAKIAKLDETTGITGVIETPQTTQTPWQAIISSPLQRCADFARALAAESNLPLQMDARLAELDFGDWEGKTAEQLMTTDADALGRFWRDPQSFTPPGGETFAAFEQRVSQVWQALSEAYAGKSVLIITHGGVIRLLLCQRRGLPYSDFLSLDVAHASLHHLTTAAESCREKSQPTTPRHLG